MKKVKPKLKKRNPGSQVLSAINKLIELLEDTKMTLAMGKSSQFYELDLADAKEGIKTLATDVLIKLK
jgi:hypothetical protein